MTGIVIAGVAHSHVDYVTAEIRERADIELRGVFDPDAEAARRIAAEFDAPVFDSLDDLLGLSAEIVACAGVYAGRADIIVAALRAGADVVCDKPLCITLDQLERIATAQVDTGRNISLMLEKRTYPETLAVVVAAEDLGRPVALASWAPHKLLRDVRAPWFLDPATYGGILADLLVHDVDIALTLTGATSGSVRGWTGAELESGFALNGGAVVTLNTPGTSAVLTAEVDWLTPTGSEIHGDYRMRVVGTEGTAELYWGRGLLELTTADAPRHAVGLTSGRRPAEDALNALLAGASDAARATADALLVTRIALLAEESARQGGIELSWKASA
ncbi:Gfo/Idh/MocA family protein [Microbacterium sp. ZW T5_56]|uniref:Gfo/Idh/MocA family protein n=1 Tax=Microbacterium sp. ZW T5_56 TaxID=3378081 RepID=UPI003854BDF9